MKELKMRCCKEGLVRLGVRVKRIQNSEYRSQNGIEFDNVQWIFNLRNKVMKNDRLLKLSFLAMLVNFVALQIV